MKKYKSDFSKEEWNARLEKTAEYRKIPHIRERRRKYQETYNAEHRKERSEYGKKRYILKKVELKQKMQAYRNKPEIKEKKAGYDRARYSCGAERFKLHSREFKSNLREKAIKKILEHWNAPFACQGGCGCLNLKFLQINHIVREWKRGEKRPNGEQGNNLFYRILRGHANLDGYSVLCPVCHAKYHAQKDFGIDYKIYFIGKTINTSTKEMDNHTPETRQTLGFTSRGGNPDDKFTASGRE